MRISDVLRTKGSEVATVRADATVSSLLSGLAEHNIGAMVVLGEDGVAGIVSERDIVRSLHEHGSALLDQPVRTIMSKVRVICAPEDVVNSLAGLMTTNRVRHVPVVDNGRLVGIVSIGDVVKNRMEELEAEQEHLQAYITQGG